MNNQELGKLGEDMAVSFLRKNDYRILERNFTCKVGEADIIAEKNGTLVFAEVKTRQSDDYGRPVESITERKQRHLKNTVNYYTAYRRRFYDDLRIDVIEITVNHIENAF